MAKKLKLNYEMTNADIIEALVEAGIEVSANPVVIDIVESENNPDWTVLFLMAEIKLKSSNGSLTKAQLRMKGWGTSSQTLRAMEAVPTDVAAEYEIGEVLEDMTFRIVDSTEKPHKKANPRQTKAGDLLVDENGDEVYRQAVIIDTLELNGGVDEETGEEIEGIGHSIIRCSPVTASPTASRTRKREVLES